VNCTCLETVAQFTHRSQPTSRDHTIRAFTAWPAKAGVNALMLFEGPWQPINRPRHMGPCFRRDDVAEIVADRI
jgi:hypothetical protein